MVLRKESINFCLRSLANCKERFEVENVSENPLIVNGGKNYLGSNPSGFVGRKFGF